MRAKNINIFLVLVVLLGLYLYFICRISKLTFFGFCFLFHLFSIGLFPKVFGKNISGVFVQRYVGNVTIAPHLSILDNFRAIQHPSQQDMKRYLLIGAQTLFPKLDQIRHMTMLEKELSYCATKWQNFQQQQQPQQQQQQQQQQQNNSNNNTSAMSSGQVTGASLVIPTTPNGRASSLSMTESSVSPGESNFNPRSPSSPIFHEDGHNTRNTDTTRTSGTRKNRRPSLVQMRINSINDKEDEIRKRRSSDI